MMILENFRRNLMLQGSDDGVEGQAATAVDEMTSHQPGYSGISRYASRVAGPVHELLGGEEVDLSAYTTPCELVPYMMQSPYARHAVWDQEPDQYLKSDKEEMDMDTLTRIMVSQGFTLD